MRYLIDAWLDQGDPHLRIIDADSGTIRLQWIYHREHHASPDNLQTCPDGNPCAGCDALHCLINHLFLLACADKLGSDAKNSACQNPRPHDHIIEIADWRKNDTAPHL